MKRSNIWFALIPIVSALFLSAANLRAENTPQAQPSNGAQNKQTAQPEPTGFLTQQKNGEEIGNRREQVDARVTEPVSIARDKLFVAFTIGFNGLLVLFSGLLLRVSSRQAKISKASQRAYCYAKFESVDGIAVGQHPAFMFVVKNFGHSPAYRMHHETTFGFAPFPMVEGYHLREVVLPASPEASVPPQAEGAGQLVGGVPLTQQQVGQLSNRIKILIWGTVRYQDTFTDWHYTNFCFFYMGRDLNGKDHFIQAPIHNDAD